LLYALYFIIIVGYSKKIDNNCIYIDRIYIYSTMSLKNIKNLKNISENTDDEDIENNEKSEEQTSDDELSEDEPINKITANDIKVETTTISTVYNQYLKRNSIDLKPSYQRSLNWTHEKMILFLDSLFYCPIVPSFILYTLSKEELKNIRKEHSASPIQFECIDGQHRLTVIKHFMEGKIIKLGEMEKYLYILEKNPKVKKQNQIKIFYNLTKEIQNRFGKKYVREMSIDEKTDFENTQLSFLRINASLTNSAKCILFNRLQNGEKISAIDKFKNTDHVITNYLRENNLIKSSLSDEWKKYISFYNDCGTDRKSRDKFLNKITFMVIRLIYITDKKSLDTNYLDINIKKYIENNTPVSKLVGKVEEIYKKNENIRDVIYKNIKKQVSEVFYYLLHYAFIINEEKAKEILTMLNNEKDIFTKFNNPSFYKDKNKVLSKETMNAKYKELLDFVDKHNSKLDEKIKFCDADLEDEIVIVKNKTDKIFKKYNNIKL